MQNQSIELEPNQPIQPKVMMFLQTQCRVRTQNKYCQSDSLHTTGAGFVHIWVIKHVLWLARALKAWINSFTHSHTSCSRNILNILN